MPHVSDFDTRKYMKSTGNRIEARRKALKMSREKLAQKLETTRMTVWRIEKGEQQLPCDELKDWARVLRTKSSELIA